jgi:hypothetical protein
MNLSQILIEAGVTPGDLSDDCQFIAQDNDGLLASYEKTPVLYKLFDGGWDTHFLCANSKIPLRLALSSDWQTPLSREQFIADYEAHCAKIP